LQKQLKDIEMVLAELPTFAVAFSGGVDSGFLLAVAKKVKPEKLIAITVASPFVPEREVEFARKMALSMNVQHICLTAKILENQDVVKNNARRCYHCKKQVFTLIRDAAENMGISTLLHAVNLDDLKDYRPGLEAADELGFLSPLVDAGFTKADIRRVSKQLDLETWNKPSQSCLATRIPYHHVITKESLVMIDEAEMLLQDMGFDQVRVRCHGSAARIEVTPDLIETIMKKNTRQKISMNFKKIGFEHIGIDIDGYTTGKMNHEILAG